MLNKILGGRYRILEKIGEGGMAFVYVALDEKLGRKVAIKVLHEHMNKNAEIRDRFQQEVTAISGLEHQNIIKVYDWSGSDSDRLWIVTERIKGKNIAEYVQKKTGRWLHPIIATFIVREIAKALEKAHSQGIVHRDIKPENVMLTKNGEVKLMDFGIAKDIQRSNMTQTGTFMGSPSYMSPEQIRGKDVDHRSDIYSLSVLYYEVVTGRLPFVGHTTHDVVLKIMEGQFTYPRFLMPSIPEVIDSIIVKGMSKDTEKRFQSSRGLGLTIDDALASLNFVESHIELERYFKDRKNYVKRLEAMQFGLGQRGRQIPSPTNQSKLPITLSKEDDKPKSRFQRTTRDTGHGNAATSIVPNNDNQFNPQPVIREGSAVERPKQHKDTLYSPAMEAATVLTPHKPVRIKKSHKITNNQRTAYKRPNVPRQRMSAGYAKKRASRLVAPRIPLTNYVFGILIVGLISAISVWGFWELQLWLNEKVGTSSVIKKSKATSQIKKPVKKKSIRPKPSKKAIKKPSPSKTKIKSKKSIKKPNPKPKKTRKKLIKKRRNAPKIKSATLTWQNPVKKTPKKKRVRNKKPRVTSSESILAVAPAKSKKRAVKAPTKSKVAVAPPPKGDGEFFVSSQPAAQIYIDGRSFGTTNATTSGSGWIKLKPGRHSLELKRGGHTPHKQRFTIKPGQKFKIPNINMQTIVAKTSTLTLRANQTPVHVTILDKQKNTTQVFTMSNSRRLVQLPAGSYNIKIEYKGQVKERTITLGGGSMTFAADFKDK